MVRPPSIRSPFLRHLLYSRHFQHSLWPSSSCYCSSSSTTTISASQPPPNPNSLMRFIRDKIRTSGPISVAEYMQLCVGSQMGYYSRKAEVFGAKGDFITSPELTQVFGELLGAWIAFELQMTGWNGRWQLVELGPGSGELMTDLLSVLHKLKAFSKLDVHLVECSEHLASRQKQKLQTQFEGVEISLHWHQSLDGVPWDKFSVFIANEFFDALPVHLFERDQQNPNKWHEQYVNIDKQNDQQLCFMLSSGENIHTQSWISQRIRDEPTRTSWEFCPQLHHIALQMVQRFTAHGGFGLIIDYGHDGSQKAHSLRAYKGHQLTDPLQSPGENDLTSDVDFGELVETVKNKCLLFGPVEQRQFLGALGLAHRLNYLLAKCASADQRRALLDACRMLVGEQQMGTRFKAVGLFPKTLAEIMQMRGGAPSGFCFGGVQNNEKEENPDRK